MRRISFALTSAAVAACSLLTGCVEGQEAILVTHAIPFPAADMCTADPDGDTQLAAGAVDLSFSTGFTAAFAVVNNLNETGVEGTNTGIEASEMNLLDVIVTLDTPGDPALIAGVDAVEPSLVRFSQKVATASFNGGDRLAPFVFIPASSLDALSAQMDAAGTTNTQLLMEVVFRAQRSSNTGVGNSGIVESRPFTLPIEVCKGCLRSCVSTVTGDSTELCTPSACAGPVIAAGGACGNAQGGPVSPLCCTGENADGQAIMCGG